MIERGGKYLDRWATVIQEIHPTYKHDIPPATVMNIGKLSDGGALTSDTCNSARKTRRFLVDCIKEKAIQRSVDGNKVHVTEIDWYHHLINLWLGSMFTALSFYLKVELEDELDNIDTRLRVSPHIEMILQVVDKDFSLYDNYPKGHGELFSKWIDHNHPGALLLHIERASGYRQDFWVKGAGAVYWNKKYWVEFLDTQLRNPGGNILQENLFIISLRLK